MIENNKNNKCNLYHSKNELTKRVWSIRWNHRGDLLASCGDDKTVKLWKYNTTHNGPCMKYLYELNDSHNRTIRNVSFSPSDHLLATCGFDAIIVVYEFIDNEYVEIAKLEGHESEVKCCAFSTCGQFLASCSRDKSVWFWQLDEDGDFQVSSILQPHTQDVKFVVWHPNDQLLVSCSYDCSIKFFSYDGDEWICDQKLTAAHQSTVWCADFSADGNSLASVGADCFIKIWHRVLDDETGKYGEWKCACSLKVDSRWPLYTISWNHLNGIIAVAGADRYLRLYRIDGQQLDSITLIEYHPKVLFDSEINSVDWNPKEANLLAIALDSGHIGVLDIHNDL